jgi:hypothetical protein
MHYEMYPHIENKAQRNWAYAMFRALGFSNKAVNVNSQTVIFPEIDEDSAQKISYAYLRDAVERENTISDPENPESDKSLKKLNDDLKNIPVHSREGAFDKSEDSPLHKITHERLEALMLSFRNANVKLGNYLHQKTNLRFDTQGMLFGLRTLPNTNEMVLEIAVYDDKKQKGWIVSNNTQRLAGVKKELDKVMGTSGTEQSLGREDILSLNTANDETIYMPRSMPSIRYSVGPNLLRLVAFLDRQNAQEKPGPGNSGRG